MPKLYPISEMKPKTNFFKDSKFMYIIHEFKKNDITNSNSLGGFERFLSMDS